MLIIQLLNKETVYVETVSLVHQSFTTVLCKCFRGQTELKTSVRFTNHFLCTHRTWLSMPIRCTWTGVFTAHWLLATPMKIHKRQNKKQKERTKWQLNGESVACAKSSSDAAQPLQRLSYQRHTLTRLPFIGCHYFVIIETLDLIYEFVLESLYGLLIWNDRTSFLKCSWNWCVM